MVRYALHRLEHIVLHRPWLALAVAAVLVAAGAWLGLGIELRTARSELIPEEDASQARWLELGRELGGLEPLVVVLEAAGDDVRIARLERAADEIASLLDGSPEAGDVFYRVDVAWLERNLLYLAPADDLERAFDQLVATTGDSGDGIEISGIAALNDLVADRIEASLGASSRSPSPHAADEAGRLADLLGLEEAFLAAPEATAESFADSLLPLLGRTRLEALTAGGYLATRDERALFLLVGSSGKNLESYRRLVASVRGAVDQVLASYPEIRYGLTGPPAMEVEEMRSIRRDGWRTSAFAAAGVLVLSLLAFQRRRHALMGLVTLAVGIVWTLGAVRLQIGYLNMITTSLIPILVGMGVGYAVHLLSQYEIERQNREREEAVRVTYRTTTAAVTVSALTTAAAFFCFLFMRFRGFSELGEVTGVGIVLCLLASLAVLPALLMVRGAGAAALGHRFDEHAVVDRVWNRTIARSVCRFPLAVVIAAIVATGASGLAAFGVRLDPSLLELLPAGAESLRYLELMNDDSALSNDLNIVVSEDLDELERLERKATEFASIERFESVLDFLPGDPEASARAVRRVEGVLDEVSIGFEGSTTAAWGASLSRLETALADAADAAFVSGLGELSGELERARRQAESAAALIDESGASARLAGERLLLEKLARLVASLREAATASAPTLESLPRPLRERFVTSRGRYLAYLHPAGDIYAPEFLAVFNLESSAVSRSAIGFPVLFEHHSRLITDGFELAFASAGALIFLLLLLDLRQPVHTLLALTPVVLGTVWMLGIMRLLEIDFNFANLIAVPIVLGVGIDGGVHVIHRFRLEGSDGLVTVVAHTGRAVLIASLTTMVGFGSLALATHRGMASLGLLLLAGVGTSLLATLVLLPNLLLALGLARR